MTLMQSKKLSTVNLNHDNFKFLLRAEIDMCDNNGDNVLMYLCNF